MRRYHVDLYGCIVDWAHDVRRLSYAACAIPDEAKGYVMAQRRTVGNGTDMTIAMTLVGGPFGEDDHPRF